MIFFITILEKLVQKHFFQPHEIYDAPSKEDRLKVGGEENYRKLMILFANFIQAIGEQLKIRQQVIATATGKDTFEEYFSLELKIEAIYK